MSRLSERYRDLFPAVIQGNVQDSTTGAWRHAWSELSPAGTDAYTSSQPGARSGTTTVNYALEINNNQTASGVQVWMRHRDEQQQLHFEFHAPPAAAGGAGTITVQDVSASPSVAGVSTLQFDKTTGLVVATGTVGASAKVTLQQATPTQSGGVIAGNQSFLGPKTFQSNVYVQVSGTDATGLSLQTSRFPGPSTAPTVDMGSSIWNGAQTFNPGGSGGFDFYYNHAADTFTASVCASSTGTARYGVRDSLGNFSYGASGSGGGNTFVGGICTVIGSGGGGSGTVTGVTAGTGLTGGTITTSGTIALAVPVSVANGGTGTASPSLAAGAGVAITGAWPGQTVALNTPVSVANGGTGTASPSLVAGAGVAITGAWPNQTVSASGGPTATCGEATLAGSFSLTATDVWLDTGLSVTLPAAGTYLLFYSARISNYPTAGAGVISNRLYDVTAAAAVANTETGLYHSITGAILQLNGSSSFAVYAVAAAHVVRLEVKRNAATWGESAVYSNSDGRTKVCYVRVA